MDPAGRVRFKTYPLCYTTASVGFVEKMRFLLRRRQSLRFGENHLFYT
jgi:hypothetical protein